MSMRMTVLGNGLELAFTFGVMGWAWGKRGSHMALTGLVVGGFAGMLLGLLRIPADPFLYPIVRGLYRQIYLIGSGTAVLTAFLLGYLASDNRRWLTGLAAGFGWVFGAIIGAPFYASGRGGLTLDQIMSDSFGVGLRGACPGVALAFCLLCIRRKESSSGENNAAT